MIPIYCPNSDSEAAAIAALMQAYDIPFVMSGGAFSSMYPGPLTNSLNAQTLMVDERHVELARELIKPFLASQA